MRKILSLTSKDFFRGIGSPYDTTKGLFEKAEGIDFMRYPGLLAAGYIATDISTAGSVDTNIKWIVPYPGSTTYVFCYGNAGTAADIYRYKASDNTHVAGDDDFPRAISNSEAQGMVLYKDKIIYSQDTQVGIINDPDNVNTPNCDDDGVSGAGELTDNSYHPMIVAPDGRCYVADVNELNSFSDVDNAPSNDWSTGDFVLETGYTITALETDGRYLIIGATKYPTVAYGSMQIKIFYWDFLDANTWIKKYTIPEVDLWALKKKGDWIYAFTRWGVYRFNFSYSPQLVISEATGITNLSCEARQGAVDEYKGHLLWGRDNVWAYGPPYSGYRSFLSNPLIIGTGGGSVEIHSLKVIRVNKIYVGMYSATAPKLYSFQTGNSSTTTNTAPLDLGQPWEIMGLRVVMYTGASVSASVTNVAGTAILSETITSSKLITTRGTANPIVNQAIISLTINSVAKIKRIDLMGEPRPEYYA